MTRAQALRELLDQFEESFPWDWPAGMTVRVVVARWLADRVADAEAEEAGA